MKLPFSFSTEEKKVVYLAPQSIILLVLVPLLFYFIFYIADILLLVLLSFIIMLALRPGSLWLRQKLRLPKAFSILIMHLALLVGIFTFLLLVLPPLVKEITNFVYLVDFPALTDKLKSVEFSISMLNDYLDRIGQSVNMAMTVVNTTFGTFIKLLTIFVVSIYLMADRDNLHKKIGWFTNKREHFEKMENFLDSVELQLGGWVRGELVLMLAVGMFTFLGLFLLGIPYALPLSLIAGLLEIVPNIGPTVSAVPAVIIAFIAFGPVMAVIVLLLFVLVQQLENNILVPKVMSVHANVNPLVSIISILVGFKIFGAVGALLAIPGYIILRTAYVTFFSFVDRKHIEKMARETEKEE